jgi:hypothetical protein
VNETWHADTALLERYTTGGLDDAQVYSVEAHVLACERCRSALTGAVPATRLETIWAGTVDRIDQPRPRPLERLLRRLGVSGGSARLLAATPSLQLSWLAAVALAVGFATAASYASANGVIAFLGLAPLLPVAGVAAAYGPGVDPAYELVLSSPLSGFRLVLLRAVAVLSTSIGVAGLAALGLSTLDWTAAAWVLPALALTGAALALSTLMSPERAGVVVTVAWVAVVLAGWRSTGERLAAFHAGPQVAYALVALAAAALVAWRRDLFDLRRTP